MSFPTVSFNADSIIGHKAQYQNFTSVATAKEIQLAPDGNHKVLLAARTDGTTLKVGLSMTHYLKLGDGDDVTVDFSPVGALNLYPIRGTVKVYVDDLLVAQDDANETGASPYTLTTVAAASTRLALVDVNTEFDPVAATLANIIFVNDADFDPPVTGSVVSVYYKALRTSNMLSLTGSAPLDASEFLKSCPFSFHEDEEYLIVRPADTKSVTIAYGAIRQ